MKRRAVLLALALSITTPAPAQERGFAGIVASATPEATAAGVSVLEAGGNAIDAAIAVSLTLAVTEPAGSGIGGQTVMLVKRPGEAAFVIHGTTWSPREIPEQPTKEKLSVGRTASTVPSTLRVLDLAHRRFGSGKVAWEALVQPAIDSAESGFLVGPFRERAFRFYGDRLRLDKTAASVFFKADGSGYDTGDRVSQPLLAATLRRIADGGAMDFYDGRIAKAIADDMAANGGWITFEDLEAFPEPAIVPAIRSSYRGWTVETLPPPFGGWVVLQILNLLERNPPELLDGDDAQRRLALLDALRIGHSERRVDPITDYGDYADEVAVRTSKDEARRLLQALHGGETTHFSVVDAAGTAVAVTQSIDSYFGAKVAHPRLGFLYNNYMQGFQIDDPAAPYYIEERQMPLSSMSATIVSKDDRSRLVLGSPGSARIISAVAQVASHWVDIEKGVAEAVGAYRVHLVPPGDAYVEGPELPAELLAGMAERSLRLMRPAYGVSDSHLDPYFGGVHALALEDLNWTGAADPRRDGRVGIAGVAGEATYTFTDWNGPALDVRLFVPDNVAPATAIVIVIHGWSREADRYFDDWRALAQEHGFVVVVPHFPVDQFPSSNEFNQGHVFDAVTGAMRQADTWTFASLEALFDDVVSRIGGSQSQYTLYGHSAGAQFVHRFLWHMPDARVRQYIAANAGWYTLPDPDIAYPYGLDGAGIGRDQLAATLGKDVILMLGREDVDTDDPDLRKTPEANAQGPNRYVRGLTMFEKARAAARELGAEFNWRLVIVDDAAHVNAQMAAAAAEQID